MSASGVRRHEGGRGRRRGRCRGPTPCLLAHALVARALAARGWLESRAPAAHEELARAPAQELVAPNESVCVGLGMYYFGLLRLTSATSAYFELNSPPVLAEWGQRNRITAVQLYSVLVQRVVELYNCTSRR